MRLWHYKIIPYLPKSQLIAQWRELNSIFSKQDNHILISYIYDYDKEYLYSYSNIVLEEIKKRGYQIKKWDNYNGYFRDIKNKIPNKDLIFKEHDKEYFSICFWNLKEKYIRGQKDFDKNLYESLCNFYIVQSVEPYNSSSLYNIDEKIKVCI